MIIDARRRRLLYRASHRGTKEMDLILGGFAEQNLGAMAPEALDAFESLIDVGDQQFYDWLTGKEAVPAQFDTPLMAELKRYCASASGVGPGRGPVDAS